MCIRDSHEIVRKASLPRLPQVQRHTQDVPLLRRLKAEDVGARPLVVEIIRRRVPHAHQCQDDKRLIRAAMLRQQRRVNATRQGDNSGERGTCLLYTSRCV